MRIVRHPDHEPEICREPWKPERPGFPWLLFFVVSFLIAALVATLAGDDPAHVKDDSDVKIINAIVRAAGTVLDDAGGSK